MSDGDDSKPRDQLHADALRRVERDQRIGREFSSLLRSTYFPGAFFFDSLSGVAASSPNSGRTPYNSPRYFPPAYISGGDPASSIGSNPMLSRTPYNAPTYFPLTYFHGGSTEASSPPKPWAGPRTRRRVLRRNHRLAAIDRGVCLGALWRPDAAHQRGADSHPLAIVTPRGWEELDDADPTLQVRRVLFTIRIVIRLENDSTPFDQFDQLAATVQAEVDGSNLDGHCLGPLTKIRAGRYQTASQYPEWSIDLDGEFTLLVDPSAVPALV